MRWIDTNSVKWIKIFDPIITLPYHDRGLELRQSIWSDFTSDSSFHRNITDANAEKIWLKSQKERRPIN